MKLFTGLLLLCQVKLSLFVDFMAFYFTKIHILL